MPNSKIRLLLKVNSSIKLFFLFIFCFNLSFSFAQTDTIKVEEFKRYTQTNMSLTYGNYIGEVSNFTKHTFSMDMQFAEAKDKHIYGFKMSLLTSNKVKEFTLPVGYIHYDNPAALFIGFFYSQAFSNPHFSHFNGTFGIDYAGLLHRKRGESIGGYHGVAPNISIARSIKVGKPKYTEIVPTGYYSSKYEPSISNMFLDIYVQYNYLILNNLEGRGSLLKVGLGFKLNRYPLFKNIKTKHSFYSR